MNKNDDTSSNILHIINNFNLFLKIIENKHWARKASAGMIMNSFKLASFIEKAVEHLNNKSAIDEFTRALKIWLLESEKRDLAYEINSFKFASDHILENFLCNRAVTIESANIALRIYISSYPVERLQRFLKEKILQQSSFNVLLDAMIDSSDDAKEIEARMILKEWEKLINEGNVDSVKQSITEMFSNYRLSKSLHVLLKMLCIIPEIDTIFKDIKDIIMEKLQGKLLDQSVLNKDFWYYIFKELDVTVLSEVCLRNRNLIDLLFNFIVYIASMMNTAYENNQKTWVANKEFCLYPEITYDDLFKVIKRLHGLNDEVGDLIVGKITNAHKISSSKVYDDILFSL